jgi:hypothetical protein
MPLPPDPPHLPPQHPPVPPEPPDPPEPPHPPHPPHPPEPPQPPTPPAPPQPGGTPSITSWTRIEPRSRDADMRSSVSARLFDPMWLLTRQWQTGEFQAEDAGTPVMARVRASSAMFSRCHLGNLPADTMEQAPRYDVAQMPLDALVERRPMRPANASDPRMLTLAVEAGLHFLRMLDLQPTARSYRHAFIDAFALQGVESSPSSGTTDTSVPRFVQCMAGRALDARRLAAALRTGTPDAMAANAALNIDAGDRAEVAQTASAWLAWYDALAIEPDHSSQDAWLPERMEYAVSIAARLSARPEDEVTLSADEFDDGVLDWTSFDVNAEVNLGTVTDHAVVAITRTAIPSPLTFRGTPAPRFWELEDALIDYGLTPVGPTDLAHLMMIEYANSYGNDWFVVPLALPVGSLTRVDSLVVTDSFGARFLLRPIGDRSLPQSNWAMWQMSYRRRPGQEPIGKPASNLFFLPPTSGPRIEGAALEDVLFMRDEMANVAWAIERVIENALEQPTPRSENEPEDTATSAQQADGVTQPLRYRLSSTVPAFWIPLLPLQTHAADGKVISRLRRGAVLQPDGSQRVHAALGDALAASGELLLFDEEVPREGQHLTRRRVLARWIDGSTWMWTAFRKEIGRGEGSSGLVFDRLD